MKKYKKQLCLLITFTLVPVLLICTLVIIIDPFFVYHAPLKGWYYTIDNQLEQNPGIARHFDYDSVILGSSMTTNFDPLLFDEALGTKMIKLSYNAACPNDINRIMEIVSEEKDTLSHVILCIDIANYLMEPGSLSYAYPEHLYDNNPFNDMKYLLNKDVLSLYIVKSFLTKENTPLNEIYWHWPNMIYDEAFVLSRYTAPEPTETVSSKYSLENLKTNMELYIGPYINSMPDTQFHIFFPPYSMLYWHTSLLTNEVDIKIDGMAYITQYLAQYPNVKIHYFQNNTEWICNLNNYTDPTHHTKQITDEITNRICNNENLVTVENYQEILEQFKDFIKNYNYQDYFTKSP